MKIYDQSVIVIHANNVYLLMSTFLVFDKHNLHIRSYASLQSSIVYACGTVIKSIDLQNDA